MLYLRKKTNFYTWTWRRKIFK